jgi:hypothetical protein
LATATGSTIDFHGPRYRHGGLQRHRGESYKDPWDCGMWKNERLRERIDAAWVMAKEP